MGLPAAVDSGYKVKTLMASAPDDLFGIAPTDDDLPPGIIIGLTPATGWRAAFVNPNERDPEERPIVKALAAFALVDFVDTSDPSAPQHIERAVRPMVGLDDGEVVDVEGTDDPLLCLIPPHVSAMEEATYIRDAFKRRAAAEKKAAGK